MILLKRHHQVQQISKDPTKATSLPCCKYGAGKETELQKLTNGLVLGRFDGPGQEPVVLLGLEPDHDPLDVLLVTLLFLLGWEFMSCSHCQELGQLAVLASDWLFVQPIRSQLADLASNWLFTLVQPIRS